jgi:4-hydroxybenzoate polyprenyltransferase
MPLLQLVRWKNLLIILLTQSLVWKCILAPGATATHSLVNFICLSLSTVFIAAAGYVINDYYDVAIDAINKPGKTIIGTFMAPEKAMRFYTALNFDALLFAGYVAWKSGHWEWLVCQLLCIALLRLYSLRFKRWFVVGNTAVSLLTALTIIVLAIYEPAMRMGDSRFSGQANGQLILLIYAFFAFLLTWMREVVKDMEDLEGDMAAGCTTMPIKRGLAFSVGFTKFLGVLTAAFLFFCLYFLWTHEAKMLSVYTAAAVVIPLGVLMVRLKETDTRQQFHTASQWLKVIMLLGILSLLLI